MTEEPGFKPLTREELNEMAGEKLPERAAMSLVNAETVERGPGRETERRREDATPTPAAERTATPTATPEATVTATPTPIPTAVPTLTPEPAAPEATATPAAP